MVAPRGGTGHTIDDRSDLAGKIVVIIGNPPPGMSRTFMSVIPRELISHHITYVDRGWSLFSDVDLFGL